MAAPALPVTTASHVPIGHDAATGEPVEYVAAIPGQRVCNGLITGTDTSALVEHLLDRLRHNGWDIERVDADDIRADEQALDALYEAERRTDRHRHDPYHLVVWEGIDRLLQMPALRSGNFVERLADLADGGPGYGVAQLATTSTLDASAFGGARLRNLLADNVIALPGGEHVQLGFTVLAPNTLPRGYGHALVLAGDRDLQALHVHLDGCPPVDGCSTCWRAEHERLGQPDQPPRIAAADAVFAEHPPTGRVARWARGAWRFLNANPGDETPTPREAAELEPVDGVLRGTFG
jgi:hypothetical protein